MFTSRAKKYFNSTHITRVAKDILDNQTLRKQLLRRNRATFGVFGLRRLVNVLTDLVVTYANRETLMSVIDVGYRFGYNRLHVSTILFNGIMFGITAANDWQYYLLTPAGLSMLYGLVNDPASQHAFINMLTHASVMGVNPTDILVGIPNLGIRITNMEGYLAAAANFGARRTVYEALTRIPGYLV